jgi:hypothetical protein
MKKMNLSKLLASVRLPEWVDLKVVAILLLIGIFLTAMSWSNPMPEPRQGAGMAVAETVGPATGQPTAQPGATRSPTPIPQEWVTNREMASGIVLGAVVLVLIIVGGTLGAIRRR